MLDNLKPNYVLAQQMAKNDERIVTAGWDNTAKIWDTQTGTELLTLIGHGSGIFSVTYSSNGQQIVTSSVDNTAKIWDAKMGQELFTLTSHDDVVRSAAYSPDGRRIMTSSSDGTVKIHTTDMDELIEIAKSRVTRQLTTEEKEKYGVLD